MGFFNKLAATVTKVSGFLKGVKGEDEDLQIIQVDNEGEGFADYAYLITTLIVVGALVFVLVKYIIPNLKKL